MKKLMVCFLVLTMVFSAAFSLAEQSDLTYVKDKGVLVIGITDFAPMDYKDENGEWIGFDADVAKLFAEMEGISEADALSNITTQINKYTLDIDGFVALVKAHLEEQTPGSRFIFFVVVRTKSSSRTVMFLMRL